MPLKPPPFSLRNFIAAIVVGMLLLGVSVVVNVIGIRVVGSVDGWETWRRAQAGYFLAWRLLIYAATAYFWWRAYRYLRQRQAGADVIQRLRLIGLAAVITLIVTESGQWLQHG